MSALFSPFAINSLTLANRIVVAPMCQYSAERGCANNWHLIHLGQLALSGAGLLIVEATAVEDVGRITPSCLGLWSDEAAAIAHAGGRDVVMNRCLKIEHARFAGGLHLAGFDTGVVSSRRRPLL